MRMKTCGTLAIIGGAWVLRFRCCLSNDLTDVLLFVERLNGRFAGSLFSGSLSKEFRYGGCAMFSSRAATVLSSLVLCISFGAVPAIFATPIYYGDLTGNHVIYTSITEDSTTDPTPLFGTPSIAADSLIFNPVSFGSSSSGGSFDITDGTLATTIQAISPSGINKLKFSERGDYTLFGNGTRNTNASVSTALFVRIIGVNDVPITPVTYSTHMVFSPSDGTYNLIDDPGMTQIWQGGIEINLDAILAVTGISGKATRVDVTLDNQLITMSEAGTISYIKKKEADGVSITAIVPEPSSLVLLIVGVFGILACTRGCRHH
jgi:hypothetical protein